MYNKINGLRREYRRKRQKTKTLFCMYPYINTLQLVLRVLAARTTDAGEPIARLLRTSMRVWWN